MSLQMKNVSFAYQKHAPLVLDDFSYNFKPGRFYGIFGANGSGKSTLLKLAAGEVAGTGTVELDGRKITDIPNKERARMLAVGAQKNEVGLPFSARECIQLGRYAWGDDGEELIEFLLKEWHAQHLADKPFCTLSGGEQQRIKLLRILAQNSRYILLDEPAAALDWSCQLELYEKLQTLAVQQLRCVIMVCHDLYIAPAFVDEMLLLKNGSVVYSGAGNCDKVASALGVAFDRTVSISRAQNSVEIRWKPAEDK